MWKISGGSSSIVCAVSNIPNAYSRLLNISLVHHHAWRTAQVLHRDLSPSNLMCTFDKVSNQPIGVLNDWDHAVMGHTDRNPPPPSVDNRTGTPPFMALELLVATTATHFYRHDLESFFWVLLWIMVHYNLSGEPQKKTSSISDWGELAKKDTMASIGVMKSGFLSTMEVWKNVYHFEVHEDFKPLVAVLQRLHHLIWSGREKLQAGMGSALGVQLSDSKPPVQDKATIDGFFTYKSMMEHIMMTSPPMEGVTPEPAWVHTIAADAYADASADWAVPSTSQVEGPIDKQNVTVSTADDGVNPIPPGDDNDTLQATADQEDYDDL